MRRLTAPAIALLSLLVAACTLTAGPSSDAPASTSTIPQVIDTPAPAATAPTPAAPFATLESDTGPYADQVALLDGVCFEYLAMLSGSQWTWTSPGELAAFYDEVDESELCPGLVARGAFDFAESALVGAVNTATGCDAAHRVIGLDAGTQTLQLAFDVVPGCDYELVQPFLIAVPRPPEGAAIQVVVIAPAGPP